MTDAETIAELQAEVARLKAERAPSWGDNLKSVVDYVTTNKVKLAALLLSAASFAGVLWNRIAPATDHAAVQQVAHEEVKAKLPEAVEKAVEARPVPPPIIQQVPISPGTVKPKDEK